MKTIKDVKVGDTVWILDEANGRGKPPEESVVSKVGSKLVTTGTGWQAKTFRKENCRENDNYGHWMVIPDIVYYEERRELAKILRHIAHNVSGSAVSLDDAKAAAKLLGIELP